MTASFSAHRKFAQIRPKAARNPSLGQGCCSPLKEVTQRLTGANSGYFCVGRLWGDTAKPEEADVRVYSVRPLSPASRPRRAAKPILWLQRGHFCVASGLPQTWKHSCSNGWTQRSLKFARNRLEVLLWCLVFPPKESCSAEMTMFRFYAQSRGRMFFRTTPVPHPGEVSGSPDLPRPSGDRTGSPQG